MIASLLTVPLAVDETDFDFYNTAAQVIPLIFVALAFEFRGQGGQFLPPDLLGAAGTQQSGLTMGDTRPAEATDEGRAILRWAAVYTFMMTLVLAAGEVIALQVIAHDNPWDGSRLSVAAALTIGGLGIVVPIAIQQYNVWTRVREPEVPAVQRPVETAPGQRRRRARPTERRPSRQISNVPLAAFRAITTLIAVVSAIVGALSSLGILD